LCRMASAFRYPVQRCLSLWHILVGVQTTAVISNPGNAFFSTRLKSVGLSSVSPMKEEIVTVDFCGDLATDSSTNPHCHPLVGGLPVLRLYFMLPFAKSLYSRRRSVCCVGFPGRIVDGDRRSPGALSSLFLDAPEARHLQHPFAHRSTYSYLSGFPFS
jgi:hypothetical protein